MSLEATLRLEHGGRAVGGRWVWRDIEVVLRPGDRLALSGPSGSGKTLLLRALTALDALDEGTVALLGTPLERWSMPSYRTHVAYVPQRPVMVEGSVEDNLRLPFTLGAHAARAWDRVGICEALDRLGRGDGFLTQDALELSGGEQQLVALLRRLQLEPTVLLLDEPSASLDDDSGAALEALVDAWHDEAAERVSVWTSHRSEQLARVGDRTLRLAGDS